VVLVITLGVVLLLMGGLMDIPILWILGLMCAVIGGVLWLLGSVDRKVGPRRHYW
jgi:hypothetical protein